MEEIVAVPVHAKTAPSVRRFEWRALDRLSKQHEHTVRSLRRSIRHCVDWAKLAEALGELVGQRAGICEVCVEAERAEHEPTTGLVLGFRTPDGRLRLTLELERALVVRVVSAVLGRPARVASLHAPLEAPLAGAAAAIALEVARRAHHPSMLEPLGPGPVSRGEGEHAATVRATVELGADAFRVRAAVLWPAYAPEPPRSVREQLAELGELPIALTVVGACATMSAEQVEGLAAGDVWLPASGWSKDASGALSGSFWLAAPGHEACARVTWTEAGQLVVLGDGSLRLDGEVTMSTASTNHDASLAEAALEAPLVVRAEIGTVTMSARRWSEFERGDVITLGEPVGTKAVLRIAGCEVARGELVDVDGELGVRITELVGRSG